MIAIVVAVVSYNLQSEGKFLVKGTCFLGLPFFVCTTSPQDRSTVMSQKWTFFILLAHTYFYAVACLKFQVFGM